MSILFLGTEDNINEQDLCLMQALAKEETPFMYACSQNSSMVNALSSLDILVWEMPTSGWERFMVLKKIIKQKEISYVHVLDENAFNFAKKLKTFGRLKFKILAGHHGLINLNGSRSQIANTSFSIKAIFSKKITKLFVSSPSLYAFLQKFDSVQAHVTFLPFVPNKMIFDQKSFQCLAIPNPNERFIFLVDTEYEKDSGFDVLFQAIENLKNLAKNYSFEIRVLGQGSKLDEIMEKAESLDVLSLFSFFTNCDKSVFYASSHALICPAIDNEGNFHSIIRGWQANLPIISSDLSAYTKILLSGQGSQSAMIYPKDSPEVLAKSLLQIMQDEELRNNLVETGKKMLVDYDLSLLHKNYMQAVNRLAL